MDNRFFSEREFQEIVNYFYQLSGNRLTIEKLSLVESRLRKRISDLNLTISKYIELIKNSDEECKLFISSLTTHKTDWFREPQHYEFLKKTIISKNNFTSEKPCLIWSAASSSGEELYSSAIIVLESGIQNVRLLGTDLSESHVLQGMRGIYPIEVVDRQVQPEFVKKYFLKGSGSNSGYYKISDSISHLTKWKTFNLLKSDLGTQINFDYIFLRNVLIYFSSEDVDKVVRRLVEYIKPGGYFIVGLSESFTRNQPEEFGLTRIENSVYQKC